MKPCLFIVLLVILAVSEDHVRASQADDTTITITAKNPGPTPFISQLTLVASNTDVLRSIQFTITPKPGSVTRSLSGTYSNDYLTSRGYIQPSTGEIFLPVYGLYADYTNTVTLTYNFGDGSSKGDSTTITTPVYDDPCQYGNPTVLQARSNSTDLSYDFILVRERCNDSSPTIIDTDSAVRWIGSLATQNIVSILFDNAIYQALGRALYRIDLDGTVTFLHDYADFDVTYLHHNIDRGKVGLILDVDTSTYFESTNIEVDAAGNVLKIWNLADIISAAMTAGGDDPSQFVYPAPADWFHNNSVAYNRADDSIIISSRENFVICLDYETGAIKWILGDPTKKWYQFPSLRQYALTLPEGSNPPIGQHSVSISYDQNLLLFDNGFFSWLQMPAGENRNYSTPRRYQLNLETKVATEVWNYTMGESINSAVCSSVYDDAPSNYLLDYAFVFDADIGDQVAQLLGLDASGATVFHYQYPNAVAFCDGAYNSVPLHLENTKFPSIGPQTLNISTRGLVSNDDDTLIGGFIIPGTQAKLVALRVLGPSLTGSGVAGVVANPLLMLFDASGTMIAMNDDWASDPAAAQLSAEGLAPSNAFEAATQQLLAPGAYTVVARSKDGVSGLGLVEAYDLSPSASSKLSNLSTRGFVCSGDDVLIGGFIVGDVANATIILRGLGPSLPSSVGTTVSDPILTVYDSNGVVIGGNDDWQDDVNMVDIENNGLAPLDSMESATILHPPAGNYTAIVSGANGSTGVGQVEIYDLD
jgi:hypothetical protein